MVSTAQPRLSHFHGGILVFALLCLQLARPSVAWAQFVDPSFAAPIQGASALAMQPDGRLIVGGVTAINGTNVTTRVVRLLASGAVDPTFNAPVTGGTFAVSSVAVDGAGRVLVGGSFTVAGVGLRLARLLPDGTIDPTFTPVVPGPRVTHDLAASAVQVSGPSSVVVQPDGRILYFDFSLRRLNADGTNDPTFTAFAGTNVSVRTARVLADGRILVGGSFPLNGSTRNLARLMSDGTLDPTFDVTTPLTPLSTIATIAVRPDGRILAAGGFISSLGYPIRQFSADGVLDPTFNAVAIGSSTIDQLLLEPDGSVLVAGWFDRINGQSISGIARLDAVGTLDSTFVPYPSVAVSAALARLDDGRIYVAGQLGSGPSVVRLFPSAITPTPPGPPTLTAAQVVSNPVRFTWTPGVGAPPASYELQVGSVPGASDVGIFPMGLATAIEAAAPPMVRLYLRVMARNAQGSAVSNEVTFILGGVSAPNPPVLTATQVTVNPITLSWGAVRGPSPQSYTLVAGSASGQSDLGVFPMGLATSITANAPVGLPVFVRMIGANTGGSAASNEITFTVSPPQMPPAPVLQPAGGTGNTVTLSWSGSPGSTYIVIARLVAGGPIIASLPVAATSTSVPNVPNGTYVVSVVAVRAGLTSPESNSMPVVVPRSSGPRSRPGQ
ncbi:MAG: hypothetical protein IT178_19335 [Acidobacteria bacterium]|nr:hypothetical protein [Acidobacteriota bacterium]